MNLSTTNDTINMDNANLNLISSKEYEKKELITALNQKDNMKINIIEKDKIIFNYMKQEKDFINKINELNNDIKEKEIEILKLNQDKNELEYNSKKKENSMNQIIEKYINENEELKNRLIYNEKALDNLKEKLLNKENIIKLYDLDKKDTLEQNNKKNNDILELINQIKKNENLLKNMKTTEKNLKEENKTIPVLKRKIEELNFTINQYKEEINELKNNNMKMINDKEELNNIININKNEIKKEKVNEQYVIRLNYKIDYLSKELNNKNIENEILNNQNISLSNDLNNFFNIFTTELNNYLNYLESLNVYSKSLHKLPLAISPSFDNSKINEKNRKKYENLINVINRIKEKIIDILNKNIEKNQDIFIDVINKDNNYKSILNEKDELIKNKIELENNIICANNEINKYKTELQIFKKDFYKIKTENSEIKNKNKDLLIKNKSLKQELNDLINDIQNQLKNFPISNNNNNKNKKDKNKNKEIINKINSLIILNKELNDQIKNIEIEKNKFKDELNQTFKDNSSLKNELNIKTKEKKNSENEIIQIKLNHEKEISDQKKLLYEKIYKLNNLLEESNSIIKTYEKEISLLRNKNDNLENNLKILTKSHTELEKIINSNTSGLKTELDIKEQKYNDILKELSIKDIHIKSLEKIIENQNKPTPGKIFTKIEAIPANFEENKYKTMNDNFISDKYEEIKLNKLINGYEINNKVNEFYKNENNINIENNNNNNVDINDLIKFSGGNQ